MFFSSPDSGRSEREERNGPHGLRHILNLFSFLKSQRLQIGGDGMPQQLAASAGGIHGVQLMQLAVSRAISFVSMDGAGNVPLAVPNKLKEKMVEKLKACAGTILKATSDGSDLSPASGAIPHSR